MIDVSSILKLPELRQVIREQAEAIANEQRAILQQFRSIAADFIEETNSASEGLEPAAQTVGEWGWTIPSWGPVGLIGELARYSSPDDIDIVFLNAYRKRGGERQQELFTTLTSRTFLHTWRPLLLDAIATYRSRRYRVVVPALLTMLEGALFAAADPARVSMKVIRTASEHTKRFDPGLVRLNWISVEAFLSTVFRKHDFSEKRPPRLNRHWVLHGNDIPDWGRTDCLRLFQALDTLALVADNQGSEITG